MSAGLVGMGLYLALATTKIKLLPNGHSADYFCNSCRRYLNGPAGSDTEPGRGPGGITLSGKEVGEAASTTEGL